MCVIWQLGDSGDSPEWTGDSEAARAKRGHVLKELLDTERVYVSELCSILKVSVWILRVSSSFYTHCFFFSLFTFLSSFYSSSSPLFIPLPLLFLFPFLSCVCCLPSLLTLPSSSLFTFLFSSLFLFFLYSLFLPLLYSFYSPLLCSSSSPLFTVLFYSPLFIFIFLSSSPLFIFFSSSSFFFS